MPSRQPPGHRRGAVPYCAPSAPTPPIPPSHAFPSLYDEASRPDGGGSQAPARLPPSLFVLSHLLCSPPPLPLCPLLWRRCECCDLSRVCILSACGCRACPCILHAAPFSHVPSPTVSAPFPTDHLCPLEAGSSRLLLACKHTVLRVGSAREQGPEGAGGASTENRQCSAVQCWCFGPHGRVKEEVGQTEG